MNFQPPAKLNPDDNYLDEAGAFRIANRIRAYWKARGFLPNIWVKKILYSASPTAGDRVVYVIRSDLLNGRPQ